MTPNELINIAYQEDIEIEPTTIIPHLNLIQNTYGPFTPLSIHKIPIYLALHLKQTGQCRIRLPHFYTIELMAKILEKEKEYDEYQPIHPYFFECLTIIEHCYNVEDINLVYKYVNDIKHVRYAKTSVGIANVDSDAVNLNNITPWEFSEIRTFMLRTMEESKRLEKSSGLGD